MTKKVQLVLLPLAAVFMGSPANLPGQVPATSPAPATQAGAPRQSGTIKAVTPQDFVLTGANGQDYAVTVPASARILLVDPATRDLKSAQPGTMADVAAGDKAIVNGSQGDAGQSLTATRVLLLKSGAITALHAQEQAAWARSVGGIVKTADSATGVITAVNGTRSYTVNTSGSTLVRRYSGASVRFEDAVKSNVAAIQPGDQIQARGQRSTDGTTVTADEIVAGSFSNFSGTLTAVDPTGGSVTLKDLATKKMVTIAISGQTNLRKLPTGFGQGGAARPNGAGGSGTGEQTPATTPNQATAGGSGSAAASGAGGRTGAGRLDLSRIVNRLPTETTAELKPGDAVLVVASNSANAGNPTAITLVSGVEQILAASPAGGTTLSPWSLGGQSEGGEGASGGSAGPGGR